MVTILVMYILDGAVAGILAGLLGIGGGVVIVPLLVFCFVRQGIPDELIMLSAPLQPSAFPLPLPAPWAMSSTA